MTNPNSTSAADQRLSLEDAYFAYRQTGEGWYSVAFESGKWYARLRGQESARRPLPGGGGEEPHRHLCRSQPRDLRGSRSLWSPAERTDGSLLLQTCSSFKKTYWLQEASDDTTAWRLSEAKPRPEVVYAVARRYYRSLLDVTEGIYEATVLDYRFPTSDPFPQALRREIERLNAQQIERGSLDRYVLVEYPKHTGRVAEGPEHAWAVDLF